MAFITTDAIYRPDDWRRHVVNTRMTLDEMLVQQHRIAAEQALNRVKGVKPPEKTVSEKIADIDVMIKSAQLQKERWKDTVQQAIRHFGEDSDTVHVTRRRASFYIMGLNEQIKSHVARRDALKPRDPDICDLIREESE